jgi:hypothetical protein
MKRLLFLSLVLCLAVGGAQAGPNSNGAIIVHTNDAYNYSAGTACTTTLGMPASCADAITRSDKNFVTLGQRSTVWFLAAFLPGASPRVASVYFGTDVDDVNFDAGSNYGPCGPAGTQQVPDAGWPYDVGNSVGFGAPVIGNTFFRFYVFGLDNYDDNPDAPNPWWCSTINPTGGYAAFYDDSFPPVRDDITQFGCVRWYEAGENACPTISVETGACCFATGLCEVITSNDCAGLNGTYLGDNVPCLPDNPCPQPGACCDLETGVCTFVLEVACQPPLVFLGGSCSPINPCPQQGACCEPMTGVCTMTLQTGCLPPNQWLGGPCQPVNPCPVEPQGACCDLATGACTYLYQSQCMPPMQFLVGLTCTPTNPCPPPVATEPTTWGKIKANYR